MYLKKKGCLILSIDEKELENMSIEEKIYWYRDNIESIENAINVLKQLLNRLIDEKIPLVLEIDKTHKMCDHCRKYIDKRDIIHIKRQAKVNLSDYLLDNTHIDNIGYVEVNEEVCPICKSVIEKTMDYSKFKKEKI